ncbi:hypothetical protein CGRA01v4_12011 [Colletotrichum graminicola]|nr:hypothetical protein CGRA01v4_12011 [Colletotrichum graminicola]
MCVRCPFLVLNRGISYMKKSYACEDNHSCDDSGFFPRWKDPSRTLKKEMECRRREGCAVSARPEKYSISPYSDK